MVLWIGMILAGAGAAAIMPTSLAMLAAGTHTARARARSVTLWAAGLSAGNMLSPVLGGWLAGFKYGSDPYASWRYAPLAIAILALISVGISAAFAKNSSSPKGRSLDWPGQITVAVALFALMFAVTQGPTSGWGSPLVIGGFVLAVIFLILFILAEGRAVAPLLSLGCSSSWTTWRRPTPATPACWPTGAANAPASAANASNAGAARNLKPHNRAGARSRPAH